MVRCFLVLAVSVLLSGTLAAQESGKDVFAQHCAVCHGVGGEGGGVGDGATETVSKPVPDLTLLAQANGGVFPMLRVIHVIDGRTGLRGHGGEMPVFGNVFRMEFGKYGVEVAEMESLARILSIAYYLESIQK